MVASYVSSREASYLSSIYAGHEAPPNHDITNLVMVSSIWAVPCPSYGYFVFAKCIRQHKIIVASKLQEPYTSLVCLWVAVASTSAFPILECILSYFGVPIA